MGVQTEKAKIGDVVGGNYTEFETDGTMEAKGSATCFLDELGDILALQQTGPGVSFNTSENTVDFTNTANLSDYVYANLQFNHDRALATTIYPHVHWFQASANTPNWLLQYRRQVNGQAKVTSWTNLIMQTNAFTYTSGTIMQISGTASGIAAPGTDGISSILQIRLIRDTGNASTAFAGADAYTGTVGAISFDVHKEINTLGSRQQYIK